MRYYSTRNRDISVSFGEAALGGLAPDGGLYVPEELPRLPAAVVSSLSTMDFRDIAFEVARPFVSPDLPAAVLEDLVHEAYNFPAPIVPVADRLVLELFHGPTAAFKDFGARFMARTFSYLRRNADRKLRILVATSGDTGGAVADGFFGLEGIDVTVLYPKGRVSPLQERQIAGLGGNVSAFAIDGSFDDCQALVKAAFSDRGISGRHELSSANSINISRLVPQAIYYVSASGKAARGLHDEDGIATPRMRKSVFTGGSSGDVTLCVPSGNFGNLTAGLYARALGAPIAGFIAATNANKTVPDYLASGIYTARPSVATLSNAMDVGAPSNFERMKAHWSYNELKGLLCGTWVTDAETQATIKSVFDSTGYILDPHTAVAWKALDRIEESGSKSSGPRAVLSTAHPAKFSESVESITGPVPVPPSLTTTMSRTVQSRTLPVSLEALGAALDSLSS